MRTATKRAWWVTAIVIAAASLLIGGALLALVRPIVLAGGTEPIAAPTRVYADYLVARNLGIGLFLIALLALRAGHALSAGLLLVAAVQLLDGVLDVLQSRFLLVPIVIALAVACIAASARHSGGRLWRSSTWRDR